MLISSPMFDVKSKDLQLGSALWVVGKEVLRSKRKRDDNEQDIRKTAAIIQDVSPLSISLSWYDPSILEPDLLTIKVEQVTNGEYMLTPMVPRVGEVKE